MENKIKDWLLKTGYPLELYVQQELMLKGYFCDKSSLYRDLESDISRELDVVAYKSPVIGNDIPCTYEINLLIECKKSEKPLVVLTSNTDLEYRFTTLYGSELTNKETPALSLITYCDMLDLCDLDKKNQLNLFGEKALVGYSIVTSFSKSDENIYKGLMGLSKANEYFRNQYLEFFKSIRTDESVNFEDSFHYKLQIPVLVVDCPLFNSYLNSEGELVVQETLWANVELKLPWLTGSYEEERGCSIQVVTKNFFPTFLADLEGVANFSSVDSRLSKAISLNT